MPDKLYNAMDEQKFEVCLKMNPEDSGVNDNERPLTFISFLTYQVHTLDPMMFCFHTKAAITCIGDKSLKKIVYSGGRLSILMIKSY